MGGEDQLKALVRFAFSLQNKADKSVLQVDDVLAQAMANIKRLVETLPQEGLLRDKAWRDLEPLVKEELDRYGKQLGKALVRGDSQAAPAMRDYAVREFEYGGADLPEAVRVRNQPVPGSVEMALRSKINTMTLDKMFNVSGKAKGEAPILKALFKTVDTRVRGGIIRGETTQDIADLMATDVVTNGIPGVKLTAPVAKQIRSQAMTIARTATQDMARQVKEQVYEDNKEATEGMVWMWTTALDSKTCQTCAPLDQERWDQGDSGRPSWPLHPNCRCQTVLIDPEDDFWSQTSVNAQQVKPAEVWKEKDGKFQWVKTEPYKGKGAYKTPVVIDGKKYWRKAVPVTSDKPPTRLADVYARWATDSNASLEAAMGPRRAAFFKKQFNEFNKDPEQILNAMLTGKPGAQQWIPVEKLSAIKTAKVTPKAPTTLAEWKALAASKAAQQAKALPKAAPTSDSAMTDLQAARARLRAKRAAERKAEIAAIRANPVTRKQAAAQVEKARLAKNQEIEARYQAKREQIAKLKTGDQIEFAGGGFAGRGTVLSVDTSDPKFVVTVRADGDGPISDGVKQWKKGDVFTVNSRRGFIKTV